MEYMNGLSAMISVRSEQREHDNEDPEVIEFITDGKYLSYGGKSLISYDESELTGLVGARTTISVEGNRVTVARSGSVQSQMVFEKGHRHISLYETELGTLVVGINSFEVDSRFGKNGGRLSLGYSVEVDDVAATKNRFIVNVAAKNTPIDNSIFE